MKAKHLLIVTVTLLFLQQNLTYAQPFKLKSHKMTISGTSSLHEWESVVEKLDCKAVFKVKGNVLVDIQEAVIKIPVQSIKGSKGKMMDNKTYDAFHAEKHPWIVFVLSSQKINAPGSTADLKGTLTMAGTSQSIELVTTYSILANGDLQFTGTKKLKMTDFNMEPPTAMMGTVKVGNEVTVTFELVISNLNTTL